MSTDSPPTKSSEDGTRATLGVPARHDIDVDVDTDDTPRSEVPPALNAMIPNAADTAAKDSASMETAHDYFTAQSVSQQSAQDTASSGIRSHQKEVFSTVRASDALAAGHAVSPDAASLLSPRPAPHTTISSFSVDSSASGATITPETAALLARHDDLPRFPNQALSALHDQYHPPPYVPPAFRSRGSGPHQISTFASAIATLHSNGTRTAHNSPAVTPSGGLFSTAGPSSAPLTEGSEGSGAETHVADVDVDPVSGRKLINHYEIIDELGRGTHGKVKLGRDLTSPNHAPTYVAIKIVERFSKRRKLGRLGTTEDKVKKEVAILKKARHPNVVALLEVIDDPSRKKVYIVLEWVERGEINWRVKGPKEIGMIEARRYAREKQGDLSDEALAVDAAVLAEASKRLARQKRRQMKAHRLMKRGYTDTPEAWSIEMAGDTGSEESEEDRLSRISSLTAASDAGRLAVDTFSRRQSRTLSPLHPQLDVDNSARLPSVGSEADNVSATGEQVEQPARPPSALSATRLEGTMYGAYDQHRPSQTSRVASATSLTSSQKAIELLDSHLDSELEYVPIMTMEQIRVAFRDTLLGLQYLHYQGIVHRDIKPPNLLATIDNRVKISDFGVSYLGRPVRDGEAGEDVSEAEAQDLDDEAKELAKTVGTPAFYAPELCNVEQNEDPLPVTKAIDVWALGVTLFCMLFARTPFVETEYVVMRQICDEEIYLPRRRLQPVDTNPKSRSTSHGRAFPPLATGKRHELDLVYEEINDDLHDLLERLLIKDPRKRITLEEVRHHPWVLADLPNKSKWLEETDPSRQAEKKIEVSKEDMNTAVVPLNLVERMRSGLKKVFEKTGITRTRGSSNAGSGGVSAGSSSSTISQDARRQSLRGDDSIYMALRASRDTYQGAVSNPSPSLEPRERFFDAQTGPLGEQLSRVPSRPGGPYRAMTIASTAESMRTVTQSDFQANFPPSKEESLSPSPGLPEVPKELASPGGNHLGVLLGGPSRLMQSARGRSAQGTRKQRSSSSDKGSVSAEMSDPHGEASLALSNTTASGHVHLPDSLREMSTNASSNNSPASSRAQSISAEPQRSHRLHPPATEPGLLSRMSSSSSLAELTRHVSNKFRSSSKQRRQIAESSAEDWKRADEERVRKLLREEAVNRGRASPQRYCMSPAEFDGPESRDCPQSPDDLRPSRGQSRAPSVADISNFGTPPDSISPSAQTGQLPSALVSSTSDLGSAVSMSISNPSIPSVISEASSVDPNEGLYVLHDDKQELSSADTLSPVSENRFYGGEEVVDEGYTPDQEAALESEQDDKYDSSSDSDGGLQMTRRKTNARVTGHGLSLPAAPPKERRGTGLSVRSKKSSRSGSSNTMKKVRTRDSIDEQRSQDISEE